MNFWLVPSNLSNREFKMEPPNPTQQIIEPYQQIPETPNTSMFHPTLSHETTTFIYKIKNKLLHFPDIHQDYGYPNAPANCWLCTTNRRETPTHLFFECPSTQNIWRRLGQALGREITRTEALCFHFNQDTPNLVARLHTTAITLHKIWTYRNKLKYRQINAYSDTTLLFHIYHNIRRANTFHNNRINFGNVLSLLADQLNLPP